jgi:hypothetical protein
MTPPINIDGSRVSDITIDGTSVSEVTVDGNVVFSAASPAGAADSFDSYSVGKTGSFGKYSQTESGATPYISDTKAIDGSQSLTFDTAVSSGGPDFFDWSFFSSKQPTDGRIYLRDNSGGGAGFSLVGANGPIFNLMLDSFQVRVVHADGTEVNQNVQDEWVKFSLSNIDWSAETFDITVTNATTSTQLGSFTGLSFTNSALSFDTWRFGCHQVSFSGGSVGGNEADQDTFWFDDIDFRE